MISLFYFSFIILLILVLMWLAFYGWALLVSAMLGTPFVRMPKRLWHTVAEKAHVSASSHFVEVGSGSGDLAFYIAREYGAKVTGIELNPLLCALSRMKGTVFYHNIKKPHFELKNALSYDYSTASHIYLYMLPSHIRKLTPQFEKTASKGTIVISYTFCIPKFKKYLVEKLDTKPFPVYFYKLYVDI